ncbi:Cupredoxin [Mycena capillaripes]|nr:Cupredoxin [Mycena capillaripes]
MSFATLAATVAFALLPGALAETHAISVGPNGNFTYDPPFITAAAGDTVVFTFNPKNHSVTQSSFDAPCVPLVGGASSGFQFVSNVTALLPTWTFTVADISTPAWFHCEQVGHCGKGMVFAINAPADPDPHSFTAFQNLAIQLNGTDSTSAPPPSAPPPTSTDDSSYTTPPAQSWETATATITHDGSTWTSVYTSYDGTPSPTFAAQPMDHLIKVGADGLSYTPSNISAAIGDTVTFEFHPKNHTVTQSSFLQPCKPLAETSTTGQVGFKSGFQFVAPNATDFPTFQITINDTAPIWGYCGQQGPPVHCQQGMVFSINAVESGPNNFNAFQTLANRSGSSSSLGGSNSSGSGSGSADAPGQSGKPDGALGSARVSVAAVLVLGAIGAVSTLL